MTIPAAAPLTAEQVERIIQEHCYPFCAAGIRIQCVYGAAKAIVALLAAIAPAERAQAVPERMFPILKPDAPHSIPWSVIAPWENQAHRNHGQSLKRLAERGGLSTNEAYAILMGREWRQIDNMKQPDAGLRLMALVKERQALAASPTRAGVLDAATPAATRSAAWQSRALGLLQAMVDGDPDDGAADAVTCWMVWQREAADLIALCRPEPTP